MRDDERQGGQKKAGRGRRSEEIRALEESRRKGREASKEANTDCSLCACAGGRSSFTTSGDGRLTLLLCGPARNHRV